MGSSSLAVHPYMTFCRGSSNLGPRHGIARQNGILKLPAAKPMRISRYPLRGFLLPITLIRTGEPIRGIKYTFCPFVIQSPRGPCQQTV
ncbi:hypothetical protein Pmani_001575 [Petrolisthes manimaculis]|uniref:Uncharacterized protein n=1 Tax=Petrolisthes manimaculis TaxID=1843537 RepID=A0AAE1QKE3_9EUCA|nr:hypothetical protein Pmani_001575 [Petrolisthes manimaculis]